MEFAQILQKFLQTEKLSQNQFARRVHVSSGLVCEWANGIYKPSYDLLLNIFHAFPEVPPGYWFGLTEEY